MPQAIDPLIDPVAVPSDDTMAEVDRLGAANPHERQQGHAAIGCSLRPAHEARPVGEGFGSARHSPN
jgi:hypothetical protein